MVKTPSIEDIKTCENRRFAAALASAPDALSPLLQDLRYVHSSGVIQVRNAYLAELGNGNWSYQAARRSDERIFLRGDTAIVANRLDRTVAFKGKQSKVHSTALSVWVLGNAEGQLIAVQSTALTPTPH